MSRPSGRRRGRSAAQGPMLPGSGPLSRVPAVAVFLVVLVVVLAGLFVGGPAGAVLLAVLAVAVGFLLAATWSRLGPAERAGRALVLVALLVVAVVQVLR